MKTKTTDIDEQSKAVLTILIKEIDDILVKHSKDGNYFDCAYEIKILLKTWVKANNLKLNKVKITKRKNLFV